MNINIDELVLTGKISHDVKVGDFVFTLSTPSVEATTGISDNMSILAAYITKIVDTKNSVSDDVSTPESKKDVVDLLNKAQGAVIVRLSQEIEKISEEQKEIFDSIKK